MNYQEFVNQFQINLNKQQTEAVKHIEGPILLLAVPGSGKTTVLVTRLGYMIYSLNIDPRRILTITYTVAATKDMQARFCHLFDSAMGELLEFRTINGLCVMIHNYYERISGKRAPRLVTDEKEIISLIRHIYQHQLREYPTDSDIKTIRTLITYIKNSMLNEEEIGKLPENEELPVLKLFQEYEKMMREKQQMDYDDQMIFAYRILKNIPQVLEHFQEQYQYLCVDEAQDTSKIQHAIIALLAGRSGNLFMVGDEDQSIYGFRAAYPEALLSFEKDHDQAKVLFMEQNFRSSANIVTVADHFIQKNIKRHKKQMIASREEGKRVHNIALSKKDEQYSYLLRKAVDCEIETSVLYRDNESALPLIDLLERNHISYRIKSDQFVFFSHRIIMDITNIIRFAHNPYDTESFLQIYYKISTYFNKETAERICRVSEEKDISILEVAIRDGKIPERTKKNCRDLQKHFSMLKKERGDRAIERIVHQMGYDYYLERANLNDHKIEILKAIGLNEPTPARLLERLEELSSLLREKPYDRNSKFVLSTIHSSKGLEYDTVYLIDVYDEILPEKPLTKGKSVQSGNGSIGNNSNKNAYDADLKTYEEERRLFYVGITRAKNELNLFSFSKHSTFCDEIFGKSPKAGMSNPAIHARQTSSRSDKIAGNQNEKQYAYPIHQRWKK